MTTKLIGVKEFRRNLATYSRQARGKGMRFIVLNKNMPLFEVRPLSEKDAVLERLIADVADARTQAAKGKVKTLATVMKEFGLV